MTDYNNMSTDTTRPLELWCDLSPAEFALEFFENPDEPRHEGRSGYGKLAGTSMDASAYRYPRGNRTAFPAFTDSEPAFRVSFYEALNERRQDGIEGLDVAVAELAVKLSLDDRFTHGILAEDQDVTCMYFWSPAGRWLANIEVADEYEIHRELADRTALYFRPRVEELLDEAGVWFGYRTFDWDWQTRRTPQHSFERLATEPDR